MAEPPPVLADGPAWKRVAELMRDMRTPLTGLRGYLQGIEDGVFPADTATYARLRAELVRLQHLLEELETLAHGHQTPAR